MAAQAWAAMASFQVALGKPRTPTHAVFYARICHDIVSFYTAATLSHTVAWDDLKYRLAMEFRKAAISPGAPRLRLHGPASRDSPAAVACMWVHEANHIACSSRRWRGSECCRAVCSGPVCWPRAPDTRTAPSQPCRWRAYPRGPVALYARGFCWRQLGRGGARARVILRQHACAVAIALSAASHRIARPAGRTGHFACLTCAWRPYWLPCLQRTVCTRYQLALQPQPQRVCVPPGATRIRAVRQSASSDNQPNLNPSVTHPCPHPSTRKAPGRGRSSPGPF